MSESRKNLYGLVAARPHPPGGRIPSEPTRPDLAPSREASPASSGVERNARPARAEPERRQATKKHDS